MAITPTYPGIYVQEAPSGGVYQTVDTVRYTPPAFDLVGRFTQRLGSKRWDRTISMRSIACVGTSTALFIGRARQGPMFRPVRLFSLTDAERQFGTDGTLSDLPRHLRLFFLMAEAMPM